MKKYANERKIILECHSAGTYRVLCSTDGTTIASQGRSTAEKKNYDTFCISHIATNEPLAKEWFRDESIFYNESPIKIFDISKDGHKILFYSSKKSARGLLPGLYIIYSNQKNTFEAKQLKGYFGPYRSARFNPSGTKIITHKSVENKTDFNWWNTDNVNSPEGSSEKLVPLNSQIIFSDFIDDETIIVFVRENETFQILSYNITSGEKKSIELFRYEQNKTQDTFYNIDKNKGIIAVYHVNKNHLYILNKMSIDNNKINPITPENRFTESAIKLSSDGSTIIGDDHGKARNIFDIQTNKVLQTVLTLPVDIFNNIQISVDPTNRVGNSISLKLVPPLAQNITKHLTFSMKLSGLSGNITSLQFSRDGNNVIGSSIGKTNNLIVWPLATQQHKEELEQVNKLPISIAKLLLPLSISSLQERTTTISLEDFNRIKIAVPQGIFNSLLIEPKLKLPDKLLSRSPEILATE